MKLLLVITLVLGLSSTNFSKAEELNLTPEDVTRLMETLNACDNALNKCGVLVEKQKDVIEAQEQIIQHSEERIKELEKESDNTFELILIAVGGVLLGAFIGGR